MSFLFLNGHVVHYKYAKQSGLPANDKATRTFIFINSLGTDYRIWNKVAEALNGHGNILLYDKRGHGLSDLVDTKKGLNDYAEDLLSLIDHLSIEKCIPVGVSVGGMIAQILADKIPEKIEKLILCDTRHQIGDADSWNKRISIVKGKGLFAISRGVMEKWFSEVFRKADVETVAGIKNMLERTLAAGYIDTCEAIRDANLEKIAMNIKVPTLCIAGTEDKSILPAASKDLADLIDGSTFKEIEGSGHLPCVDNPKELTRLIVEFIA